MEALRDQLSSKAPSIDMLEFEEKLKGLEASLASKAETTDMLGLQRDVLKLGLTATAPASSEANEAASQAKTSDASDEVLLNSGHLLVREPSVTDQMAATRRFRLARTMHFGSFAAAGFWWRLVASRLAVKDLRRGQSKTSGTNRHQSIVPAHVRT